MLTVFWDMKGFITFDFFEKGTTLNSASYCRLFRQYFLFIEWPIYINMHMYIYIYKVIWLLSFYKDKGKKPKPKRHFMLGKHTDTRLRNIFSIWFVSIYYKLYKLWRCPWCNGYCRRKWTRRHEFKSLTRLIAFHIALIPLRKVWIQLFSRQQCSRADWVLQPW